MQVKGADVERRALETPWGMAAMLALLSVLATRTRHRTGARAKSPEGTFRLRISLSV
jgi:hypothetical protein